jgi:hypothetical protein
MFFIKLMKDKTRWKVEEMSIIKPMKDKTRWKTEEMSIIKPMKDISQCENRGNFLQP